MATTFETSLEQLRIMHRFQRFVTSWLYAAAILLTSMVVVVRFAPLMPSHGLDTSWVMALNEAVARGMVFGKEIIFTYGPFAALYTHTYHPATDGLALFGGVLLALALALVLLLSFRQRRWYVQLVPLVVLAGLMYSLDALLLVYPLFVAVLLLRELDGRPLGGDWSAWRMPLLVIMYVPFGLIPLIKGSGLAACAAVAGILVVGYIQQQRWRDVGLLTVVPILTMLLLWRLAGQPLLALPEFLLVSAHVSTGYSDAMAMDGNTREIIWFGLAAIASLWAIAIEPWQRWQNRLWMVLVALIVLFLGFKLGFVRHDGHAIIALTLVALLLIVVQACCTSGQSALVSIIVLLSWVAMDANRVRTNTYMFLDRVVKTYEIQLDGLIERWRNPHGLQQQYQAALAQLAAAKPLPSLDGTTDIYSIDQSVLLASPNRWQPRPVIQSYAAYSPTLLAANKAHLESTSAPDNILFRLQPVDNRYPSLAEGLSWPVLLARYAPKRILGDYLWLQKRAVPRQLNEQILYQGQIKLGEKVPIPKTDLPVYARLHIERTATGKIVNSLFKTGKLSLVVELIDGTRHRYRVVAGMMETGFLLSPMVTDAAQVKQLFPMRGTAPKRRVKSIRLVAQNPHWWEQEAALELVTIKAPSDPATELGGTLQRMQAGLELRPDPSCRGKLTRVQKQLAANRGAESGATNISIRGWLAVDYDIGKNLVEKDFAVLLTDAENNHYLTAVQNVEAITENDQQASRYRIGADLAVTDLAGLLRLQLVYGKDSTIFTCGAASARVQITAPN